MAKQATTVLEFIASGRTSNIATSVEFEGFAVRGDEGNGLRFFKTGSQSTASQTPIQRGDNSFTDANGWIYALNNGSVIYYNGSNNWFPSLGSAGVGTYTSSPITWSIASVSPSDPSVEWDFEYVANDSLRLRSGYGNASNEIDFSRASVSGCENKSGVVETAAIDEPCITSGGIEIYGNFVNYALWSEDFANSVWGKNRVIVTSGAAVAPDLSNNASKLIATSENNSHQISQTNAVSVGDSWTLSVFAKAGELTFLRLNLYDSTNSNVIFNLSDGTILSADAKAKAKIVRCNNGYFKCSMTIDVNDTSLISVISPSDGTSSFLGDGVSGIYVWGSSIVNLSEDPLYIKTESTVSAHSPVISSVQIMNNMPILGEDFTIEVDCSIPFYYNEENTALSVNGNLLFRAANNRIAFKLLYDNGSSLFLTTEEGYDNLNHRFTVVIENEGVALLIDGVLIDSSTFNGMIDYDLSEKIYIGSDSGADSLNSSVKAIRIKQSALSQAKIEARGGYNE